MGATTRSALRNISRPGTSLDRLVVISVPRGPKGQKRPVDVLGAAVQSAKIATGEIDEDLGETEDGKNKAALPRPPPKR